MKNKTIATTKEKTMKVFQSPFTSMGYDEYLTYFLTDDDFEMNNLCEAYNENGAKIGCENAGCNSLNSGQEHTKMRCGTYWDGRKYVSVIIDGDLYKCKNVLNVNETIKQEILDDYQNAKFDYEDDNVKILKGEIYKFTFEKKLWSWQICTAVKIYSKN